MPLQITESSLKFEDELPGAFKYALNVGKC